MGKSIRPLSFYNPTLSANLETCRTNLPLFAIGCRRWPCRRFRWASNSPFNGDAQRWNGIERSLTRAVIPQSLPMSATTFPTVLSLYIAQGRLRKNIRYPSCVTAVVIWKGNIHQLCLLFSSCLKHANKICFWVIQGRLTSERKTSTSPSSFSITPLKAKHLVFTGGLYMLLWMSSTVCFLAPTSALEHLNRSTRDPADHSVRNRTWTAQNATCRLRRGRGNHMHDHSRIQPDIDDVTGISLSLSLLLTKSHPRTI